VPSVKKAMFSGEWSKIVAALSCRAVSISVDELHQPRQARRCDRNRHPQFVRFGKYAGSISAKIAENPPLPA
jgi:hypothetical protein